MNAYPQAIDVEACSVDTDVGALWLAKSDEVVLPCLRQTGRWEPSEAALLRRLFTPTTRFLDVGAHVGYFSLFAARTAPRGQVDAVEPDPLNCALLRMNVWPQAPHVRVHNAALGSARHVLPLVRDAHNTGNSLLADRARQAATLVPVIPADELFAQRTFDVVKVDVQGQEASVLRGMQSVLQRNPNVHIVAEFFPEAIAGHGQSPAEVLRLYRDMGLRWSVNVQGLQRPMADAALLEMCERAGADGSVNLLLTRQHSART